MPFKPNYNQQRAERKRVKDAKKQEKLQRKEAEVAKRRAARDGDEAAIATDDDTDTAHDGD